MGWKMRIGLIWLRIGTIAWILWTRQWTFGFHKRWGGGGRVTDKLSDCQLLKKEAVSHLKILSMEKVIPCNRQSMSQFIPWSWYTTQCYFCIWVRLWCLPSAVSKQIFRKKMTLLRDLGFSRRWRLKSRSSGLWRHAVLWWYMTSQPRWPRLGHIWQITSSAFIFRRMM
jgi:hypothetical protein